jgi:hypothetical protein
VSDAFLISPKAFVFTAWSTRRRSPGSLIAFAIARVAVCNRSIPGLMSVSLSSASSAESNASTPGSGSMSNMMVFGIEGKVGWPVGRTSTFRCNATASSWFAPSSTRDRTRMYLTGTSTRCAAAGTST